MFTIYPKNGYLILMCCAIGADDSDNCIKNNTPFQIKIPNQVQDEKEAL
jgi:hypothetical protein